jgi:acyl dehydratase
MVTRGVYSKAEQRMIDELYSDPFMVPGWFKSPIKMVATEESMKNYAAAADYWNLFWRDDNYAANTRWGGIIAIPMYEQKFGYSGSFGLNPTPEVGHESGAYIGEDWIFYKPVRPGDSFKVWRNSPKLEDVTSLDGKGPRRFTWMPHDASYINQNDELVSSYKTYLESAFYPEPPKRKMQPKPKHKYTKEELAYIDRAIDAEEIRGAKIRYWEDVNIGDETAPVAMGPTTVWDMISFSSGTHGGGSPPLRDMRKKVPHVLVTDPETGVTYHPVEHHYTDLVANLEGTPHAFHFGNWGRQLMARCITNWMGDDGFLRKYSWRHLTTTPIGDALIGRGKVTGKRVENGEHLVDLEVYLENIRGNITEASVATVRLSSKEAPDVWK